MPTISACLVVYNEEKLIERCLQSLQGLVTEIIVVHDGECTDQTLIIARKFTDKIFVRPHVGIMEAHLAFAFKQATGDWLLRIDADEYLSAADFPLIHEQINDQHIGGLILEWELWNGKKTIYFSGLQKMCLMRKDSFRYGGIPHENGTTTKPVKKIKARLHHQPLYSNVAWSSFIKKMKKWIPVHAQFYFPKLVTYECFNTTPDLWIITAQKVRQHIILYIVFVPFKMLLGQLKNGLVFSWYGWQVALQQFVYYQNLYWHIWQMERKLASR